MSDDIMNQRPNWDHLTVRCMSEEEAQRSIERDRLGAISGHDKIGFGLTGIILICLAAVPVVMLLAVLTANPPQRAPTYGPDHNPRFYDGGPS